MRLYTDLSGPDLVVTFNGTSTLNMMYVEYQSPVSIPSPVNITSKFSQYIQWYVRKTINVNFALIAKNELLHCIGQLSDSSVDKMVT